MKGWIGPFRTAKRGYPIVSDLQIRHLRIGDTMILGFLISLMSLCLVNGIDSPITGNYILVSGAVSLGIYVAYLIVPSVRKTHFKQ